MKGLLRSSLFWFSLSAVVVLLVGLRLIWWQWDWLHPEASTTVSNSETLRNVGLLLGGALAFVFAGWRAWVAERQASAAQAQAATAQAQFATVQAQANIAQQSFLNERYQRGVEMLGSPTLSARLDGIFTLRRLSEEYPEQYHVQVLLRFCAFVRNPVEYDSSKVLFDIDTEPPHKVPPLREDVQAIMDVIGARRKEKFILESKAGLRLNLRGSDLRGVNLTPNTPKDTDGRREDWRRGMRELQGRWPGLDWGRWEVGGGTSVTAQAPNGRLRELGCAGWQ